MPSAGAAPRGSCSRNRGGEPDVLSFVEGQLGGGRTVIEYFRGRSRAVRIGWTAALVAILPVVLDLHLENTSRVNGEITAYSYFSFSAILAALCGLVYAFRQFSAAWGEGALPPAAKVALAVVVLVSLLQGVRGSGIALALTDCQAAHTLNLCRPPDTASG